MLPLKNLARKGLILKCAKIKFYHSANIFLIHFYDPTFHATKHILATTVTAEYQCEEGLEISALSCKCAVSLPIPSISIPPPSQPQLIAA